MLREGEPFLVRSNDGTELLIQECWVETDIGGRLDGTREVHKDHYFREVNGDMQSPHGREVSAGRYEIGGKSYSRVN